MHDNTQHAYSPFELPVRPPGDTGGPLLRRRWWTVVAAALCAAATVLFLPFSEHFVKRTDKPVVVRHVSIAHLPPRMETPAPPSGTPAPSHVQPMPARPTIDPPPLPQSPPQIAPLPSPLAAVTPHFTPRTNFALDFTARSAPVTAAPAMPEAPPAPARIPGFDQPPVAVVQRQPVYPAAARRRRTEGHVDVRFVVSENGDVVDADVIGSSHQGIFEQAALRAVRKWQFKPATKDGRPVSAQLELRIRFELDSR